LWGNKGLIGRRKRGLDNRGGKTLFIEILLRKEKEKLGPDGSKESSNVNQRMPWGIIVEERV